jgi:hypothetical protein
MMNPILDFETEPYDPLALLLQVTGQPGLFPSLSHSAMILPFVFLRPTMPMRISLSRLEPAS